MKRLPSLLLTLFLIFMLFSCKEDASYTSNINVDDSADESTTLEGKKLMEQKCYVCHGPSAGIEQRIAPPMVAVKSHYLTDATTKEEFADAIWKFVQKPNEENSKMRGAVRRFGVMPYQLFNEEEIRQIADYMYEYKIDEPKWFKNHIEEESSGKMKYRNDGKKMGAINTDENKSPAEIGMEYALNTKKQLGKNLMGVIQKKGTLEALKFCNVQAYPITDSMAIAQNATIKRVSDQPRNPKNQADPYELEIIEKFKKAVAAGNEYKPVIKIENGRHKVYYPILTNSMCLQCHGVPNKDIQTEVLASIENLYPTDKAKGYDVNQVRGMWSVTLQSE